MIEELFNCDLDLNLDLGVDAASTNNLDFLSEDIFKYIGDDLKDITENDAIPDIESLINFDEDDQLDDLQWDQLDLDTVDFLDQFQETGVSNINNLKNEPQNELVNNQNSLSNLSNLNNSNQKQPNVVKSTISNKSKKSRQTKTQAKQQQKQQQQSQLHKQQQQSNVCSINRPQHETLQSPISPATTGYSTETNDSVDFIDMFPNYYSLDSNNNLISHPISELPADEISKLNSQMPYSFDLSNNFGGFVNVQSALNLVNGASSLPQITRTSLLTGKLRRNKSKGTSLLANKPKTYRTIKKEMLLKKNLQNKSTKLRANITTTNDQTANNYEQDLFKNNTISISKSVDDLLIINETTVITTADECVKECKPAVKVEECADQRIKNVSAFPQDLWDHDYCSSYSSTTGENAST